MRKSGAAVAAKTFYGCAVNVLLLYSLPTGTARALKSSLVVAARAKLGEGAAVTIVYADGSTEVVPASWRTLEESAAMGGAACGAAKRAFLRQDRDDEACAIADGAGGGREGDKALARLVAMAFFEL